MVSIYIHVPFCIKKCSYCDFFSKKYSAETAEAYTNAVVRNLKGKNLNADTVYFGGGTPSLLSPKQIDRILSEIYPSLHAEITMECNPITADRTAFVKFSSAGINRISIGVQSFIDKELTALGRLHNAETAEKCIEDIYAAKIENISADIMLGTPYQTEKTLTKTLNTLIKLPITHVSAYMLKVEEDTPLAADPELLPRVADDDLMADMYALTCKKLESAGFGRYEISNFAKEGFECRHNMNYWRCGDYLGIGPSAHSCKNGKRYSVPEDIGLFISSETQQEVVTDPNACGHDERIMLALRTSEGFAPEDYEDCDDLNAKAEPLIKAGFMRKFKGRLSLTDKGAAVSNDIIARLIT